MGKQYICKNPLHACDKSFFYFFAKHVYKMRKKKESENLVFLENVKFNLYENSIKKHKMLLLFHD